MFRQGIFTKKWQNKIFEIIIPLVVIGKILLHKLFFGIPKTIFRISYIFCAGL